MSAIDKVVSHFKAGSNRKLTIDEWGLDIYADLMSLESKSALDASADKAYNVKNGTVDETAPIYFKFVYALIKCAKDKDGNKLFDAQDSDRLWKEADDRLVSRAAMFVLNIQTDEEREKN